MRIAKVRISSELLRDRLCFPQDAKFVRFETDEHFGGAGFDLVCVVESASLPVLQSGNVIPPKTLQTKETRHSSGDWVAEFAGWC